MEIPEDLPFLRAILHRPQDNAARSGYADWLEERGDRRAQYLRRELELNALSPRSKRREALQAELLELYAQFPEAWTRSMWRRQLADVRFDLTAVPCGSGQIRVQGEVELALFLDDRLAALQWDDASGGGLLFGQASAWEDQAPLPETLDDRPLADQFEGILSRFAPGMYELLYSPARAFEEFGGGSRQTLEEHAVYGNFDEAPCFVELEPLNAQSRKQEAACRRRIESGARPLVLTAGSSRGSACEFVLEGRFALAAYYELGMLPAFLSVRPILPQPLDVKAAAKWFPKGHPGLAGYRRMKRSAR